MQLNEKLFNVTSGIQSDTSIRAVMYGVAGSGKSTLASLLDKDTTLFLDVEDGTKMLDVNRIRVTSFDQMMEILLTIHKDPGHLGIKNLVIDGLDTLETMMINSLCIRFGVESIEQISGGYGKGYTIAAEEFQKLLRTFNFFINAGINVLLIGHRAIQHIDEPNDFTGKGYDRYTIQMVNAKKSTPMLVEWADVVVYAAYETTTVEVGNKVKAAGSKRVLYTDYSASFEAKNRLGLPSKLPMTSESINLILGNTKAKEE